MRLTEFLRGNARWLSAGALLTLLSGFGQTFFISIFAGDIREAFGLSHGAWGGMYSLGTTASAVVMIWAGVLTDRFRVRALGAIMLVMLAAACLAMALNPWAALLPFVIFALRFSGQGMMSHIATVAMARWFIATRGRALAFAALGFSLGEAFLPLGFVSLMGFISWRALWVLAAVLALCTIPVLVSLLREERTPGAAASEIHASGMGGRHWLRREVLGHWLFWMMVPALMGPSAFITAFFFQQVHLAESKQWAHAGLVALFPLYTAVSIGVMMVTGWAVDRFGTPRVIPYYQLPMALGFVILSQVDSLAGAALVMAVLGVGVGANTIIPNAFWAEFYGTQHLGAIKAMAVAVMVLGSAIGPGITGVLIDYGISFADQSIGIAVWFLTASAITSAGVHAARRALTYPL